VQYNRLHPKYQAFIASLDRTHDPMTFGKAMTDPKWCQSMRTELQALGRNAT